MKKEYLIVIFLLLGPLLDVSSFYQTPISIIIRGLYVAFIIIDLLKNKKNIKELFILLLFSILLGTISVFIYKYSYITTLSSILKIIYLPCSIYFFKDYLFPEKK